MMGTQFVRLELKVAVSLIDIASHSFSPERRKQLLKDARRSYDTVLQVLPLLSVTGRDREEITGKLCEVRGRLEQFGISVPISVWELRDTG
jgi:hypothetical protein